MHDQSERNWLGQSRAEEAIAPLVDGSFQHLSEGDRSLLMGGDPPSLT